VENKNLCAAAANWLGQLWIKIGGKRRVVDKLTLSRFFIALTPLSGCLKWFMMQPEIYF
jgi:hypothetical protein